MAHDKDSSRNRTSPRGSGQYHLVWLPDKNTDCGEISGAARGPRPADVSTCLRKAPSETDQQQENFAPAPKPDSAFGLERQFLGQIL